MSFWQICINIFRTYAPSFLLGVRTTLIVSLSGTLIGLAIGLVIGGFRAVRLDYTASFAAKAVKKIFDLLTKLYIDVFRGTPMMVQAVFLYYALLNVIHWDKMTAAVAVISINTGAYMAEIVRSGIQAVDPGQNEAARSLGMSSMQTMMNVVLPQAIRNAFPAIGNELIVNIKDSSVLNVISVSELFFQAKSAAGTYYKYFEVFFIIAVIYLVLTLTVSRILRFVEKKMDGPDNYVICGSQSDSRSEIVVSKEQEEEVDRQWQSK